MQDKMRRSGHVKGSGGVWMSDIITIGTRNFGYSNGLTVELMPNGTLILAPELIDLLYFNDEDILNET